MASGIYEIVNAVNGKRYVGSAVDIKSRWDTHRRQICKGKHPNRYLQSAWNKSAGKRRFVFRVLLFCSEGNLIMYEQIALDNLKPEYNLTLRAGNSLGTRHSAETRALISQAKRGKPNPHSKAHKEAIRAVYRARGGKPTCTPEAIARMAATKRGGTLLEEHKNKIAVGLRKAYLEGRKKPYLRTEEIKRKISASLKGISHSLEQRAKQAAAQTGLKRGPYNLTSEERENRSARMREQHPIISKKRWPNEMERISGSHELKRRSN